jgi:hypothetical protein
MSISQVLSRLLVCASLLSLDSVFGGPLQDWDGVLLMPLAMFASQPEP